MAAITPTSYRHIVAYLTRGLEQVQGVSEHYYDAAYEIVMLQEFIPEIDLLLPFWQGYLAATTAYATAPASVVSAVRRLQKHVLDEARTVADAKYANIDAYYDDTNNFPGGWGVSTEFADISEQCGYAIDAANVNLSYNPDTEAVV
jgi:hypothetical protein